jgi:hypothetical protein
MIAVSTTDLDPAAFDVSTVRVYNTSSAFGVVWDTVAMFGSKYPFNTFAVAIRPDGRVTMNYWEVYDPSTLMHLNTYARLTWAVGLRPPRLVAPHMAQVDGEGRWVDPRAEVSTATASSSSGLNELLRSWWTSTPGIYPSRRYVQNSTHFDACPLPSATRLAPYTAQLGDRPCVNVSLVHDAADPSVTLLELRSKRESAVLACARAGLPLLCRFRSAGASFADVDAALAVVEGDGSGDDVARCAVPGGVDHLTDNAALAALLAAGELSLVYAFADVSSISGNGSMMAPMREKALNLTLVGFAASPVAIVENARCAAWPASANGSCPLRDCAGVCGGTSLVDLTIVCQLRNPRAAAVANGDGANGKGWEKFGGGGGLVEET